MLSPDTQLALVPQLTAREAALFVGYLAAGVLAPGWGLLRLARLQIACRYERWAWLAILGFLWSGWLAFGLTLVGRAAWHPALVGLPALAALLDAWLHRSRHTPCAVRLAPSQAADGTRSVPATSVPATALKSDLPGLALVAAFVACYLLRIASAVQADDSGLRLYGAWFSDKAMNSSPMFALLHEVPPRSLRMAGEMTPHHYFPHLLAATLQQATGIDVVRGFWFYAAAAGIAISGLAVLAFVRRRFGSTWIACLGLLLFGLLRFDPEAKPLDLSLPMLLLALLALDRARQGQGRRWAVAAVALVGLMPAYEAFYAMAVGLGLGLWWAAAAVRVAWAGWRDAARRADLGFRTAVTAASGLLMVLVVLTMFLGPRVVAPARFVCENSFRTWYRQKWFDAARQDTRFGTLANTLLTWKRGEVPDLAQRARLGNPRPGLPARIVGTLVFEAGLPLYVLLRHVNLALFGMLVLLGSLRKRESWLPSRSLIAALAVLGYGLPCVVTWGLTGDGRWWDTANLDRLIACAYLLLMLEGLGLLVQAVRQARRARWWLPLGLAGYQAWVLAAAWLAPVTSYHHVDFDRLGALACLRQQVPFGDVVIHPWIDELIRDSRHPQAEPWVYKRHFTLGSTLAGQVMYFEGREDHVFFGGFVAPADVYRRSRLRRAFYQQPDAATLDAVLDQGRLAWVVADADHPAPEIVTSGWTIAYDSSTVRVYRRP